MDAALGIPLAITDTDPSEANLETLPCLTLVTYLIPSSIITIPSPPDSAEYSVFNISPLSLNVITLLSPIFTTTILPSLSIATPLGSERASFEEKIEDDPSGMILRTISGFLVFEA